MARAAAAAGHVHSSLLAGALGIPGGRAARRAARRLTWERQMITEAPEMKPEMVGWLMKRVRMTPRPRAPEAVYRSETMNASWMTCRARVQRDAARAVSTGCAGGWSR
jgi:hypothetical protein